MAGIKNHTLLKSSFPVFLPYFKELSISDSEFLMEISSLGPGAVAKIDKSANEAQQKGPETNRLDMKSSPFIDALAASDANIYTQKTLAKENKTLTENEDVALLSTKSALVDLFYELKDDQVSHELLQKAWKQDPVMTLKIIFNARSIHLGKGERVAFYKAFGWIYQNHPRTFLMNLPWLSRPIIPRPKMEAKNGEESTESASKKQAEDDEFEMVALESSAYFTTSLDRENGLAHGYWKDLVNMLVLAAKDEFDAEGDPKKILNVEGDGKPQKKRKHSRLGSLIAEHELKQREWDQAKAKSIRDQKHVAQHTKVIEKLEGDNIYRVFHLAVTRLFAEQLARDLANLNAGGAAARNLSPAAKWAPSLKEFHDKHTFLATSIAEFMFSHEKVCPHVAKDNRELYLKYARIAYRFEVLSPLRKALDIVERHISAETFNKIHYDKVPSLAMNRYENVFIKKDLDHFTEYVENVASGSKKISGAILLPSVLVSKTISTFDGLSMGVKGIQAGLQQKIIDGQWKSLVDRIKLSGKLESSIAVCDVSGSMCSPRRPDGTTPMDSAIGLSLLLADVTEPPFGGAIITFSSSPSFVKVGGAEDTRTFKEKVMHIRDAPWGMTTDFVAVFERLILPLACKNKLKQEDMVKQVFVFSDMQFNQASHGHDRWSSSYERIKKKYKAADYEMPTLIFWNLAAYTKGAPVASDEPGTALVSGYSQGQMKMFLDGAGFDGEEEEVMDNEMEDADVEGDLDGTVVKVTKEVPQVDPMKAVKKALSHSAYGMLKVID
jgi:uncharacterized protein DUF2828